jgi:predicted transposase YbfD/YdcC
MIEDPREPHRVAFPLQEILLLVVCATIADCDGFEDIADWGEENLDFLQRFHPYHYGVPSGRWLTLMMNRISPALFSACFTSWVRACWPDRPDLVAIDGKTLRGSHDRSLDQPPLHLVSAFATTAGLVLGQEPVEDKTNELAAIPVLLERLATEGGLKGAIVTIDAIACNGRIAQAVRDAGADYLLAVKANQPTLLKDMAAVFSEAPTASVQSVTDTDKGHGRIEERRVSVVREVDWLKSERRFPGELRLPDVAALVKVERRTQLKSQCRFEVRYYISSASLAPSAAADAVRRHWAIENQLHWTLDCTFNEDQSRLRKGHGAVNMAVVRHFAINQLRNAPERQRQPGSGLRRPRKNPSLNPKPISIRRRRKIASWNLEYLNTILGAKAR